MFTFCVLLAHKNEPHPAAAAAVIKVGLDDLPIA
jgi:hypothetical protein